MEHTRKDFFPILDFPVNLIFDQNTTKLKIRWKYYMLGNWYIFLFYIYFLIFTYLIFLTNHIYVVFHFIIHDKLIILGFVSENLYPDYI